MELIFTGRGAMLNPSEGNTSAYFEDEKNFFIIDCGEDVASKLISMGKLNQDKNYYLLITHTHSDHIGSIGTLQQYLYWVRNKILKIVVGEEMEYMDNILSILTSFGIVPGTYELINEKELDSISTLYNIIRYRKSNHGDTPLKSASVVINTDNGNILYTGDIADSKVIKDFLSENTCDSIDKIYIDTSLNKSLVHLSLEELQSVIPHELKRKVYCMHLSCKELIAKAKECGFNVVEMQEISLLASKLDSLDNHELQEVEAIIRNKLSSFDGKKVYIKK